MQIRDKCTRRRRVFAVRLCARSDVHYNILYTTKPSEQHEHGFEFTSQFGWNSRRLAEQYSLRLPVGPARQPR